jgi:hypothetical protein
MPVTGLLLHRLTTVLSIFCETPGLTVEWTPIHAGAGISFTSHSSFKNLLDTSTKDRSATANPKFLLRVDVTGNSDDVQPKKRSPKGPRKPPLDTDMESNMALQPRAGRGGPGHSTGSRDEAAAPPPTPPSAAPRLAPPVIPRGPPPSPPHCPPPPCRCVLRPD